MAKILSEKRVVEYTKEFKVKVVELTEGLDVKAVDIAQVLGLHPMMVYRWRQEYREGDLIYEPSRRIGMSTENAPPPPDVYRKQLKELKELRKKNSRLEKEVNLLKKWRGYLAELKQKGSNS